MNCHLIATVALTSFVMLSAQEISVRSPQELRDALPKLKDGDTLRIGPGEYPGGHQVSGIRSLKVQALDPAQPPVFKGGRSGWHFTRCPQLHVSHLNITGQSINGINLDDGGADQPHVEGIVLEHLRITDIGPQGNHDAIKCSGLTRATFNTVLSKAGAVRVSTSSAAMTP